MSKSDNNNDTPESPEDQSPPKLKLTDKLWVGFAIGIFVVAFALIVIFDLY